MPQPALIQARWNSFFASLSAAAPRSAASVVPAREPADVHDTLHAADFDLPVLREWFGLHDGQLDSVLGVMLGGWQLMSAEEGVSMHTMLIDTVGISLMERYGADVNHAAMSVAGAQIGAYHSRYFPISMRGDGTFMFVDCRPGPLHGCVREWAREGLDRPVRWASLSTMLSAADVALSTGNGYRITDEELEWDW